jgi:hypothetical protein
MPTLIQDDGHPILPGPAGISTERLHQEIRRVAATPAWTRDLPWKMWCGTQGALDNAYEAVRADDAGRATHTDLREWIDCIISNLVDTQITLAVLTHPEGCADPECEIVKALAPQSVDAVRPHAAGAGE